MWPCSIVNRSLPKSWQNLDDFYRVTITGHRFIWFVVILNLLEMDDEAC